MCPGMRATIKMAEMKKFCQQFGVLKTRGKNENFEEVKEGPL